MTLSENAAQGTLKDKNKKTYRVRYFYQRYLWLYISTFENSANVLWKYKGPKGKNNKHQNENFDIDMWK